MNTIIIPSAVFHGARSPVLNYLRTRLNVACAMVMKSVKSLPRLSVRSKKDCELNAHEIKSLFIYNSASSGTKV